MNSLKVNMKFLWAKSVILVSLCLIFVFTLKADEHTAHLVVNGYRPSWTKSQSTADRLRNKQREELCVFFFFKGRRHLKGVTRHYSETRAPPQNFIRAAARFVAMLSAVRRLVRQSVHVRDCRECGLFFPWSGNSRGRDSSVSFASSYATPSSDLCGSSLN